MESFFTDAVANWKLLIRLTLIKKKSEQLNEIKREQVQSRRDITEEKLRETEKKITAIQDFQTQQIQFQRF